MLGSGISAEIMSALLTYFLDAGNFCQAFRAIAIEKAHCGALSGTTSNLPSQPHGLTLSAANRSARQATVHCNHFRRAVAPGG